MNVDWVIPCRYGEVHDNLGTIVGAGIDTFWVPEVPTPIQVPMAIRLSALPEELTADVKHRNKNIIKGPDGQVLSQLEQEFAIEAEQTHVRTDWLQGLMAMTIVAFEAAAEGTYTFEHVVDDSAFAVPMHVVVVAAPPGT